MRQKELHSSYYGAEFGRLGRILLHDTANFVTVLQLEIEALRHHKSAPDLTALQRVVTQLEDTIVEAQARAQGQLHKERFDVRHKVQDAVSSLRYKASQHETSIKVQSDEAWLYTADPLCLRQVISAFIESLINAYNVSRTPFAERYITITVQKAKRCIFLTASNLGKRGERAAFRELEHRPSYRRASYPEAFIAAHMLAIYCRGHIQTIRRGAESGFIIELSGDD